MKKIIGLTFLLAVISFNSYAQEAYCEACSREAWLGDSAAVNKFIASCGVIDTVSYDSLNNPVKEKPTYQTITIKLNSGKVMFSDSIYFVVDSMPKFQEGDKDLLKHISKSLRYPAEAREKGITGTVFVKLIIEKDGSVKHVSVKKGIGGGCDEEAIRIIKAMPKWKPGSMGARPVRVQMILPVRFSLKQ